MANLRHLQSSMPDPFLWRKWRFECLLTVEEDDNGPSTKEPVEVFFKGHHREGISLCGYPTEKYDVREAYERARREYDPLLSPHGFFRSLAHQNNLHAREFLETFGPLYWPQGIITVPRQLKVDLSDFWSHHRRYCLVTQLWEAAVSRGDLSEAWRDAYTYHKEVKQSGPLGFGERKGGWYDPPNRYYTYCWPWEFEKKDFQAWAKETQTNKMRESALQLVSLELNLHLRDAEIFWERGWEPTQTQFRQSIHTKSLWSMIWQLFGWDTCQLAWRRCPHCQKYFYPRRKDKFYCNSRQQGLASKRDYARRMRARPQMKVRRHK
jgi:hypothetical protein